MNTLIKYTLLTGVGLGILHFLYCLQWPYLIVLGPILILTINKSNRLLMKKHRFDFKFDECSDYLQQMSFAYEKSGEITTSLKECAEVFTEGEMKECLVEGIEFLEQVNNGNRKVLGLRFVEDKFPNEQIRLFHNYMVELENIGGNRQAGIKVLREEFNSWKIRTSLFQKECENGRRNGIIALIASALLCLSVVYLVPKRELLIAQPIYQIGTTIMICLYLGIFLLILMKTSRNWIETKSEYSEEELERKVLKYYNGKSKIGRKTLKRILQKQITKAYPEWMLRLTVQIQNRDVAGAIIESEKNANVVLKLYLKDLIEMIHDYPDSSKPYLEFLDDFKTPESVAAMKMLYSISVGSCINPVEQMAELFRRTQIMQNEVAKQEQEKIGAMLYGLFLLPTLLASVKLIMDMSIILVGFTSQLGM